MKLSKKIDAYFRAVHEIHEAFGYVEQWRDFPLADAREMYWLRTERRFAFQLVPFTPANVESGSELCSESIFTIYTDQRPTVAIYEAEGLVMALLDTQTDGNVFLRIFDASRECKDAKIIKLYQEYWG